MAVSLPIRTPRALRPLLAGDPFEAIRAEMDEMLDRVWSGWGNGGLAREQAPPLDVSESGDNFQIRMDVPGLQAKDIDVEVTGSTVRIQAERKEEKEEGRTYLRLERPLGTLLRTVTLPSDVQEEGVKAECLDGVLTVTLPKTEAARTRKIPVQGQTK